MEKLQAFTESGNTVLSIAGAAGTIARTVQGSFPGCTITVYDASTLNLSTIYSDDGVTAKANPFTSASDGTWFFYAANGRFDVKFSGGGIATPFTLGDFVIYDRASIVFPSVARASLPAAGTTGRIRRVSDDVRGLFFDQGAQWFSLQHEWVDVREFGATGDGSTDDTAAIQAALDSTAKVVIFPKPTSYYKLLGGLLIASNKVLLGHGSRLQLDSDTGIYGAAIFVNGASDVRLDSLEIKCNPAVLGNSGIGVPRNVTTNVLSNRVWITNCYVHGFKTSAILQGGVGINCEVGGTDLHIIGNTVDNCDNGIWLGTSTLYPIQDVEVIGNTISNITNSQSNLVYCGNAVRIMHNTSVDAQAPSTTTGNYTITGNTINVAPVAFSLTAVGRINISNNSARGITTYGYLNEDAWYINFTNNTIQGALVNYVRCGASAGAFGAFHNITAFNNFLGSASGDGILSTAFSRSYIILNKMQSITGARTNISNITSNVVIDGDDAAVSGATEFSSGLAVPNDVAIQSRIAAGTMANILKIDTDNDLRLFRPGHLTVEAGRIDNVGGGGLVWGAKGAGDVTNLGASDIRIKGAYWLVDGMTAPTTTSGYATIYVDTSDGDLKVKFGDGTVKTLATDT